MLRCDACRRPQRRQRSSPAIACPDTPRSTAWRSNRSGCDRACAGSLYPDHVIFLGPAARTTGTAADPAKLLLRPGAGALLAEDTGASADELALCLALVLERVPEAARLRYLTAADEAELMNWDAEQYRQALARSLGH